MVVTHTLAVRTQGKSDTVDITGPIAEVVRDSRLAAGTVTVFVKHTTAGVCVIEAEDGLLDDYKGFWERIVPSSIDYAHNRLQEEDRNGHSHVRASTLGPSLAVPFVDGRMTLGTWQRVVLIDFDTRGRTREIVVQVMGE